MHVPSPRTTPVTYVVVGLLVLVSAVLHFRPDDVDTVVGWTSTNVANLTHHPIAAALLSAFVVPAGLFPDLIVVAIAFMVVETAVGTRRVVLVAGSGHVLATLVTEGAVGLAVSTNLLPAADRTRSDVGISYGMYAVVAAAILLLRGKTRTIAATALIITVGVPVLISPTMTAVGHLLSVAIGLVLMSWLLKRDMTPNATHQCQCCDVLLLDPKSARADRRQPRPRSGARGAPPTRGDRSSTTRRAWQRLGAVADQATLVRLRSCPPRSQRRSRIGGRTLLGP
jgi:hypothetical protein